MKLVRVRGKQYDQMQIGNIGHVVDVADVEEQRKRAEQRKMIKRSNERLRMLDEMGKAR
jgi:hypothetical protein